MSNSTALSPLARTADRALAVANDIAADLLRHDGVQVEFKTNPQMASFIEWSDKRGSSPDRALTFTSARFEVKGLRVDIEIASRGSLVFVVKIKVYGGGFSEAEIREGKNFSARAVGSKIHEMRVRMNETAALLAKNKLMQQDGEKVAVEVRPLLAKLPLCPSITVHPSNEAPVFALNVTLNEEQLHKVAALLATL